jgi:2-keto-4-pentenoate hydratase/2-oxohepta-3-ene-1,7-dioic acid hydratase in catechol pathway
MTLSAAPFLPDGTVYGTLLNFRHEQALWAARATEPPYKAPPQAPVLFIKTANTFSAQGAAISLPADVPEVEVGASLGLVIGILNVFRPIPAWIGHIQLSILNQPPHCRAWWAACC